GRGSDGDRRARFLSRPVGQGVHRVETGRAVFHLRRVENVSRRPPREIRIAGGDRVPPVLAQDGGRQIVEKGTGRRGIGEALGRAIKNLNHQDAKAPRNVGSWRLCALAVNAIFLVPLPPSLPCRSRRAPRKRFCVPRRPPAAPSAACASNPGPCRLCAAALLRGRDTTAPARSSRRASAPW